MTEMRCVDAIHCDEVVHVRGMHAGAHDIIETPAGRLRNRREIPEDALRLGRNTSGHQRARRRFFTELKWMKPATSIAWEDGPTGGTSSGEVFAVRRIRLLRGIRISAKTCIARNCDASPQILQIHYYHDNNASTARFAARFRRPPCSKICASS